MQHLMQLIAHLGGVEAAAALAETEYHCLPVRHKARATRRCPGTVDLTSPSPQVSLLRWLCLACSRTVGKICSQYWYIAWFVNSADRCIHDAMQVAFRELIRSRLKQRKELVSAKVRW